MMVCRVSWTVSSSSAPFLAFPRFFERALAVFLPCAERAGWLRGAAETLVGASGFARGSYEYRAAIELQKRLWEIHVRRFPEGQDIEVDVYDGKHHPVDSKEIAFVIAARNAWQRVSVGLALAEEKSFRR